MNPAGAWPVRLSVVEVCLCAIFQVGYFSLSLLLPSPVVSLLPSLFNRFWSNNLSISNVCHKGTSYNDCILHFSLAATDFLMLYSMLGLKIHSN